MSCFITGSHAYGTPHKDSDVDLVVLVPDSKMREDTLNALGIPAIDEGSNYEVHQFKIGKLNLIMLDEFDFGYWKSATEQLIGEAPVTRERACKVIIQHRVMALDRMFLGALRKH